MTLLPLTPEQEREIAELRRRRQRLANEVVTADLTLDFARRRGSPDLEQEREKHAETIRRVRAEQAELRAEYDRIYDDPSRKVPE